MGKKSDGKLMEEKIKNLNQVPYSEEAELAVLGSMLSSKEAVSKSIQWLTSDFFYKESHSKIFSVMIDLFEKGDPVDTVSVIEILKQKKSVNGIVYTLYSDRLNLVEIGFAENKNILNNKLIQEKFILLDQKSGSLMELNILIETLKQLGVSLLNNKYFKYKNSYLRHLSTLGWPIGKSLYKQKLIRKKMII